ncbi:recombinase family protein, partial [Candidatus Gottesmanbacteria bacterium]|nr:recombinase family protein [Candidatus Gottesmanbacteria bacterium]
MKYILYCRKSTDEKDKQVLSIEAQITELKEFAQREKLSVVEVITEAKTAKIPGREQFAEVLRKIEKGEADGILSWHPDRLARNSIDGGKVIYLLDTGHLKDLKFPTFWFENTPQGKFMLSIAFGQSKYYVDNLSENVKRGLRQKLRNGIWPSKAPFGYFNDLKVRDIQIDAEKSKIIKKAFTLFASGRSFADICRFLHQYGIDRIDGKPLKVDRIKNMLTNSFYIGILKFNKEIYEGVHKTFITKQLFEQVQKQVKKIERPRDGGRNFAFAGLAKCGECGAAITAEQHTKVYKHTRGEVAYIYYRCTKKLKACSQRYIQEPDFEAQLRTIVEKAGLPDAWEPDWRAWLADDEKQEQQNTERNAETINREMETVDRKLNLLLDSYLDGVVEAETYKQKKNELFEKKLKLQEDLVKINTVGSSWLEPMKDYVDCAFQAQ